MTSPDPAAVRAACERIIRAGDDTCYHLSPQGIKDADDVARAYLAATPMTTNNAAPVRDAVCERCGGKGIAVFPKPHGMALGEAPCTACHGTGLAATPAPASPAPLTEALRDAGGSDWDRIADPQAFLDELRGEASASPSKCPDCVNGAIVYQYEPGHYEPETCETCGGTGQLPSAPASPAAGERAYVKKEQPR